MILFRRAFFVFALTAVLGLGFASLSRAEDVYSHCRDLFEEWNECQVPGACDDHDLAAIQKDAIDAGCFQLIMVWP